MPIKRSSVWMLFLSILLLQSSSKADVLILNDGKVVTGMVLQQDQAGVLIKLDYGTFRYRKQLIKSIEIEKPDTSLNLTASNGFPNWGKMISTLAACEWAHEVKQIPATVIDKGALGNVPYISFRCSGNGYEINIYGDLDRPAGVEIGVLGAMLESSEAKSNCVEFVASLLPDTGSKKTIRSLSWKKQLLKKDGVTYETTLPIEEDSYGGWWVSVYDEKLLASAQAAGKDLLAISEPIVVPRYLPVPAPVADSAPTTDPNAAWATSDLRSSRGYSTSSSGSGGRVYVRSYYRKDGTYVHSHTRSAPRRR